MNMHFDNTTRIVGIKHMRVH